MVPASYILGSATYLLSNIKVNLITLLTKDKLKKTKKNKDKHIKCPDA